MVSGEEIDKITHKSVFWWITSGGDKRASEKCRNGAVTCRNGGIQCRNRGGKHEKSGVKIGGRAWIKIVKLLIY